jgi:hypothetical protein
MLSVVLLNDSFYLLLCCVIMLDVVMLNVIILSVLALLGLL